MKKITLLLLLLVVLRPDCLSQISYGSGTPGAGGLTPRLSCGQAWMGNPAFAVTVANSLGGATAWLGISFAPGTGVFNGANAFIDLAPSNLFIVQALVLSGPAGAPGAGTAALSYPLNFPVNPALAGLQIYGQVAIDEGGGAWSASAGLTIRLTMPTVVFVGTSVGGNTDPVYLVDPATTPPTLTTQFNGPGGVPGAVNNVTDAEFAHGGRRAYVSQSLGNPGHAIQELNFDTSTPTWATFFSAPGSTYGIGVDDNSNRTYTLTSSAVSTRELIAIDSDLASPAYGSQIASTMSLSTAGFLERWELSPDGQRAAVMTVFSRQLLIVNTNVASNNYMNWTNVGLIPVPNTAILPFATSCDFTADSLQVIISLAVGPNSGEVARYDLVSDQWIDHNPNQPGIQNIGPQSSPPAAIPSSPYNLDVSSDGTFAIVSGQGANGGLVRIDLIPNNPFAWGVAPISTPNNLPGGSTVCGISGDDTMVATFGGGQLVIFNVGTGALIGQVPLPGSGNVYTVTWF